MISARQGRHEQAQDSSSARSGRARDTGGQDGIRPGDREPAAGSRRADACGVEHRPNPRRSPPSRRPRRPAAAGHHDRHANRPATRREKPAANTRPPARRRPTGRSRRTAGRSRRRPRRRRQPSTQHRREPVTVTPPVRPPPPPNTEPAWLPGFRRAMDASRASLQQAATRRRAAASPPRGGRRRRGAAAGSGRAPARDRRGAERRRAAGRGSRAPGDPAQGRRARRCGGGGARELSPGHVAIARADARHQLRSAQGSTGTAALAQGRADRREAVPVGQVQAGGRRRSSRPSTRA